MDPLRRHKIESLFEAALERAPEHRTSWLAVACEDDAQLYAEVLAMLAAHERAEGILDADAAGSAAALIGASRPERIGAYRITRELGRGGMGVVYLGERDDGQFRQRVAIKVIHGGPGPLELHRRFQLERQVLAALDHPNIARLIDGGITEDGRPYLVMEHVEGLPIDEYCNRNALDIEGRLRLFCTVAHAVHHAHRNLVVHRDIKPSNIFVTKDGVAKLLDFGIAKILNPSLVGHSAPITRTGLRLMTPEYASPEQVRGESITTATDVYGLGVVLYELLAGRRPFQLDGRSPGEWERVILEEEPPRPSSVAGLGSAGQPDAAPDRPHTGAGLRRLINITQSVWTPSVDLTGHVLRGQVRRLRRQLRGDLDRIVLMALRKEPNRRYASAEQLAEDIERHLNGLPVNAHRDSRWYRVRKFVHRNRAQTAAAVIVFISLVAGLGAALWQSRLARRERDRAQQAQIRAEDALARSEALTNVLIGLFESSDPKRSPVEAATARRVLERGLAEAESLTGQPVVQARMFDALGRVYMNFNDWDRAQTLLERALQLRRDAHGDEHLEVAESLVNLSELLRRRSRFARADTLNREALAIQRRLLGDDHPVVAQTLADRAYLKIYLGRPTEAEAIYRRILAMVGHSLEKEDPVVSSSMITLATILRRAGHLEESESLSREVVALRRRVYGPEHPHVATAMLHLGDLLATYTERYDEAEALYREALAMLRRQVGNDHTGILHPLSALGSLLGKRGEYDEAEALFREALALRRRIYGPDTPNVAEGMDHLASLLARRGQYEEAEALRRQALEIWKRTMGPDHPVIAGSLRGLADLMMQVGRYREAEAILRKALIIARSNRPGDPNVGNTMADLAFALLPQGRYREAESLLLDAIALIIREFDDTSSDVRRMYRGLVELYEAWGKTEKAAEYRRLADRS